MHFEHFYVVVKNYCEVAIRREAQMNLCVSLCTAAHGWYFSLHIYSDSIVRNTDLIFLFQIFFIYSHIFIADYVGCPLLVRGKIIHFYDNVV